MHISVSIVSQINSPVAVISSGAMIAVVRLRTHGDRSREFLHALLLADDEHDVGYIYLLVTVRVGIHKIDALRISCYDIIGDGG